MPTTAACALFSAFIADVTSDSGSVAAKALQHAITQLASASRNQTPGKTGRAGMSTPCRVANAGGARMHPNRHPDKLHSPYHNVHGRIHMSILLTGGTGYIGSHTAL